MFKRSSVLFSMVLVVLLLSASVASGIAGPLAGAVRWIVFGSGGTLASKATLKINSTIGQPLIGQSGSADVTVKSGYWGVGDKPTALMLVSFSAGSFAGRVQLTWETAQEVDLLGFHIYRSASPTGPYLQRTVELIAAQAPGQINGAQYLWIDDQVLPGMTYYYQLQAVNASGKPAWIEFDPVTVPGGMLFLPQVQNNPSME